MKTSRKNEKSTQPTDQSTLLREVIGDDEVNGDWKPFDTPPRTDKILKDVEELIEQHQFVKKELIDLKDALEEQRGKLE